MTEVPVLPSGIAELLGEQAVAQRAGREVGCWITATEPLGELPQTPPLAELAALGVARVSWGTLLHNDAMARFADQLTSTRE